MSILVAMLFLLLGMASTIVLVFGPIVTIVVLATITSRFIPRQSPEAIVANLFLFVGGSAVLTAGTPDSFTFWVSVIEVIAYLLIHTFVPVARSRL